MNNITIVKIGGKIINDIELLNAFLSNFSKIGGLKILVHGGGRSVNQMLLALGMEPTMLNGRRVTDAATLEICVGQYAGNINKQIVALLQAKAIDALGLTGADGGIIKAQKRPTTPTDYGFAGDIVGVESDKLVSLLHLGFVPVFCAITADQNGQLLNTNADTIASTLAVSLSEVMDVDLRFCFEYSGILEDLESNIVIQEIKSEEYQSLVDQEVLQGGVIPKVYNAVQARNNGVKKVSICGSTNLVDGVNSTKIV